MTTPSMNCNTNGWQPSPCPWAPRRPVARWTFLTLDALEVQVVSLRHSNGKAGSVQGDAVLEAGDTLVLSGKAEALAVAEQKLLKG